MRAVLLNVNEGHHGDNIQITPGRWHQARLHRKLREGSLQLDDQEVLLVPVVVVVVVGNFIVVIIIHVINLAEF